MKIDRLLGIITILQQREKVTAPELAEKFEVSRRTIMRDVEDICKAGIPIHTFQGGDGGISIAESFKFDKSLLTKEEMQSIFTVVGFLLLADRICSVIHSLSVPLPMNFYCGGIRKRTH